MRSFSSTKQTLKAKDTPRESPTFYEQNTRQTTASKFREVMCKVFDLRSFRARIGHPEKRPLMSTWNPFVVGFLVPALDRSPGDPVSHCIVCMAIQIRVVKCLAINVLGVQWEVTANGRRETLVAGIRHIGTPEGHSRNKPAMARWSSTRAVASGAPSTLSTQPLRLSSSQVTPTAPAALEAEACSTHPLLRPTLGVQPKPHISNSPGDARCANPTR